MRSPSSGWAARPRPSRSISLPRSPRPTPSARSPMPACATIGSTRSSYSTRPDADALHQARIALRRLRSAFSLFRPTARGKDYQAAARGARLARRAVRRRAQPRRAAGRPVRPARRGRCCAPASSRGAPRPMTASTRRSRSQRARALMLRLALWIESRPLALSRTRAARPGAAGRRSGSNGNGARSAATSAQARQARQRGAAPAADRGQEAALCRRVPRRPVAEEARSGAARPRSSPPEGPAGAARRLERRRGRRDGRPRLAPGLHGSADRMQAARAGRRRDGGGGRRARPRDRRRAATGFRKGAAR